MKWTAELIDYDGNVGALAHVEADSEQEARARLAMCGVTDYIGPVKDVCDIPGKFCLQGQETVEFDGILGKWYPHDGYGQPCKGWMKVDCVVRGGGDGPKEMGFVGDAEDVDWSHGDGYFDIIGWRYA